MYLKDRAQKHCVFLSSCLKTSKSCESGEGDQHHLHSLRTKVDISFPGPRIQGAAESGRQACKEPPRAARHVFFTLKSIVFFCHHATKQANRVRVAKATSTISAACAQKSTSVFQGRDSRARREDDNGLPRRPNPPPRAARGFFVRSKALCFSVNMSQNKQSV